MAAMNELTAVHMPSEAHREFRSLVKYRKTLDSRINKIKCTIRAWFVNHGITIDRGDKAWHTGRTLINSYRKPLEQCAANELWKGELDLELTQLDSLSTQLDGVVKKLELIGKHDPRIVRLRTIPGVGPRTAEILVACIDDPHRFQNGRQVSAYFGLVPRQFQSGETDRHGRITKRGNPLARTILVECAWASLRYNPWAKGVYERIRGQQKTRKKKAGVALARKIAVIAWAMLRDEKDWDPLTMIRTTHSFSGTVPMDEQTFRTMRPKENSDQRKSRLRREARQLKTAETSSNARSAPTTVKSSRTAKAQPKPPVKSTTKVSTSPAKKKSLAHVTKKRTTSAKPRRARKPVPAA